MSLQPYALEQLGPMGRGWDHSSGAPVEWSVPMYLGMRGPPSGQCLRDLDTFPSLTNAMGHSYLEQLSFESSALQSWTRMTAEQIQQERKIAHANLGNILDSPSSATPAQHVDKANSDGAPPSHLVREDTWHRRLLWCHLRSRRRQRQLSLPAHRCQRHQRLWQGQVGQQHLHHQAHRQPINRPTATGSTGSMVGQLECR